MKHPIFLLSIIILSTLIALFLYARNEKSSYPQTQNKKTTIATTIFPLYDIARHIAGDAINVQNILPSGASPHTFEPRPSDIAAVQNAQLIFAIGHNLDPWVNEILTDPNRTRVVLVDRGISLKNFSEKGRDARPLNDDNGKKSANNESNSIDPHYWLSVQNARLIATTIAKEISLLLPRDASVFERNLLSYHKDLDRLLIEMQRLLSDDRGGNFIVFHDSWAYFADEFGLSIAGVFEPFPGKEPTPQYVQTLYSTAKNRDVAVVFTEPQLSSSVVDSLVNDLGLQIAALDPLGGMPGRESYVLLMQYNAQQIHDAFLPL